MEIHWVKRYCSLSLSPNFQSFLVMSVITFLNLYAIGFSYIPLNDWISQTAREKMQFADPGLLTSRLFYYVVTGQVINTVQEVLVPYFLPRVEEKVKVLMEKNSVTDSSESLSDEEKLMERVAREFKLPEFDPFDDYAEMVIQFGFIALFSTAWPLTCLACLCNNFVELRSDAFKLIQSFRRPISTRQSSISPWTFNLYVLSWVGSMSSFALATLFGSRGGWDASRLPSEQTIERIPDILLALFLSEHAFLLGSYILSWMVGGAKLEEVEEQRRRDRFVLRRRKIAQSPVPGGREASLSDGDVTYGIAMHAFHSALRKQQSQKEANSKKKSN